MTRTGQTSGDPQSGDLSSRRLREDGHSLFTMPRSRRRQSFARQSRDIAAAGSATEAAADIGRGGGADPAFRPARRLRPLRSIAGEIPSAPAIGTNADRCSQQGTAPVLNSSVK
jgi:hypothetical protein